MRRKFIFITGFILITLSFTSCEDLLQNCKVCKKVFYKDGKFFREDPETEYCGAELITIEATPPLKVGEETIKWECR
jgi:hypothetical protein